MTAPCVATSCATLDVRSLVLRETASDLTWKARNIQTATGPGKRGGERPFPPGYSRPATKGPWASQRTRENTEKLRSNSTRQSLPLQRPGTTVPRAAGPTARPTPAAAAQPSHTASLRTGTLYYYCCVYEAGRAARGAPPHARRILRPLSRSRPKANLPDILPAGQHSRPPHPSSRRVLALGLFLLPSAPGLDGTRSLTSVTYPVFPAPDVACGGPTLNAPCTELHLRFTHRLTEARSHDTNCAVSRSSVLRLAPQPCQGPWRTPSRTLTLAAGSARGDETKDTRDFLSRRSGPEPGTFEGRAGCDTARPPPTQGYQRGSPDRPCLARPGHAPSAPPRSRPRHAPPGPPGRRAPRQDPRRRRPRRAPDPDRKSVV